MTSFKGKLLIGIMRKRHLFRGQLRKPIQKADIESVLAFRATCENGAKRFGKIPKGISIEKEILNMVLGEWLIPDNAPHKKLIFYVHGGGYISGSCNDHRSIVAKIAKQTGLK